VDLIWAPERKPRAANPSPTNDSPTWRKSDLALHHYAVRPDSGHQPPKQQRRRDRTSELRHHKHTTSPGRIPANVSESERAMVTAGFANEVDAVNQYAAVMYATAKGTTLDRVREHPQITHNSPNVATNSLKTCAPPLRAAVTGKQPEGQTWRAPRSRRRFRPGIAPQRTRPRPAIPNPCSSASATLTAGLKCAPEIGPNVRISAASAAPVAIVFASSASATFPPANRSAMTPEPTTADTKNPVPTNSAAILRERFAVIACRCDRLLS
jgi:hypothetical protein